MKTRKFVCLMLLVTTASPQFLHAEVSGFDPSLDNDDDAPVATSTATPTPPKAAALEEKVETLPPPPKESASDLLRPHSEIGPLDLQTYFKTGRTPRYMRINVSGQKVRTSPDFSIGRTDNIDFKSDGGDLFPVASVQRRGQGAAVELYVNDKKRWIYVPLSRHDDFQFCESDACLTALADSLDFFLHGTGVNVMEAKTCGVGASVEGLILPPGAPVKKKEPDPVVVRASAPAERPASTFKLSVTPLWEKAKGAEGAKWSRQLATALDKHGKGMMGLKNISDAKTFCPNFSRLNADQKKEFYIHLFSAIARYESNFKTSMPAFDEVRYDRRTPPYNIYRGPIKPKAFSMGLFQMSYAAAEGYKPQCRIDINKDRRKDVSDPSLTIYDSQIQMECAVTVMNKWVSRDGGIGYTKDVRDGRSTRYRGGANYWSTLRKTNPATRDVISSLKRFTPCWK